MRRSEKVVANSSWFLFSIAVVALFCSGCALGNYGTLAARATYTPTAVVIDTFVLGGQIRPGSNDLGASVGYRTASYIFPRAETSLTEPSVEWSFFHVPQFPGKPVTRANTTLGLEVQATPEISGINLGYWDQVLTVDPKPEQSKIVNLFYIRGQPQQTILTVTTDFPGDKK